MHSYQAVSLFGVTIVDAMLKCSFQSSFLQRAFLSYKRNNLIIRFAHRQEEQNNVTSNPYGIFVAILSLDHNRFYL